MKRRCGGRLDIPFYETRYRILKTARIIGRVLLASISVAVSSSCRPATVVSERNWLAFRCPDGQTVMATFEPQDRFVSVHFAGHDLRLPHVISGSGARYSDGKTTFWNKGDNVLMEVDDKIVVQDCKLQRERQG